MFLLFRYYQPMCEPCLYNIDCPPCLSKEQYFIIYFGIAINTIFAIFWLFKRIKRKTIEWEFFCRHNLSIGILFLLFFVLRKVVNRKYEIALLLLVQFCISVLLSLIIESSNDMNSTFGRLPYFVIKDNNGRFGKFRSFMTKNYIYWFKYGHTILENYLNSKIRHPLQLKNQMKTSFKERRWL